MLQDRDQVESKFKCPLFFSIMRIAVASQSARPSQFSVCWHGSTCPTHDCRKNDTEKQGILSLQLNREYEKNRVPYKAHIESLLHTKNTKVERHSPLLDCNGIMNSSMF